MLVLDKYVTLEDGTGLVHIAPGHGEEDYKVGLNYKLPVVMPVDGKGFFTKEAGKYEGLRYDKANEMIINDMKADGSLLFTEPIKHSYPHCWRCKKPVIFRATEQWFISVDHDDLRNKALDVHRRNEVVSRVGREQDTRNGHAEAGLVHFAPAHVGSADPGVLLREVRQGPVHRRIQQGGRKTFRG